MVEQPETTLCGNRKAKEFVENQIIIGHFYIDWPIKDRDMFVLKTQEVPLFYTGDNSCKY